MDWLGAIGWLARLTSGSAAGLPLPVLLMAPVVAVLLIVRTREGNAGAATSRDIALRQPG